MSVSVELLKGDIMRFSHTALFDCLPTLPADTLLPLIAAFKRDPRPDKIDVGVGVYRDAAGKTPVFGAVKSAERALLETQQSKGYLGPEGDIGFVRAIEAIVFGDLDLGSRLTSLQTPGGTGALRLAAELIVSARPEARVFVGAPTWANHPPVLSAARLAVVEHDYFDRTGQRLAFDRMMAALDDARSGDVVLLHGCCHNPTGVDFDLDQWADLAAFMARRGLLPFIDLAYQGLGSGLAQDSAGLRVVLDHVEEAIIAYSCDKNFGLYRERTGALFVVSRNASTAAHVRANLEALARTCWSMPPDHGAAVVRTILEDAELTSSWRAELETMRLRIVDIRARLAATHPLFAPLIGHKGMFATLPLSPEEVQQLREEDGIYMAGSGRINVAGLTASQVAPFAAAVARLR